LGPACKNGRETKEHEFFDFVDENGEK